MSDRRESIGPSKAHGKRRPTPALSMAYAKTPAPSDINEDSRLKFLYKQAPEPVVSRVLRPKAMAAREAAEREVAEKYGPIRK